MIATEFLTMFEARMAGLSRRGKAAASGLGVDELNRKHAGRAWTIAQIFDHLMISNGPYIDAMRSAVSSAPRSTTGGVISHTGFGSFIIRGAGPGPNTPAPRKLHPRKGPFPKDILDRWVVQNDALIALAGQARGVILSDVKIKNPILPLFKMNLADMFEILAVHTQRHVEQIEEIAS